jgi:hypothetical protein
MQNVHYQAGDKVPRGWSRLLRRKHCARVAMASTVAMMCAGLLTGASAGPGWSSAAYAAVSAGGWGKAKEVPGTALLTETRSRGGGGQVSSESCTAGGNCAVGGSFDNRSGHPQALVANEVAGGWRAAVEVPGTAALNSGGNAVVNAVSCAQAGYCGAGGFFTDSRKHVQGFVVLERKGRWSTAIEVPGLAALNAGGNAAVVSVSCPTAGFCAAGGYYLDGAGNRQAFLVNETSGRWHFAVEAPGTGELNRAAGSGITSLSCASAGNCAAGGKYTDSGGLGQGFVINESSGVWGEAREVPGLAALNVGGNAIVQTVSCARGGTCAAGGSYQSSSSIDVEIGGYPEQAFVVSESDGVWGTAEEVPGTETINTGGDADVSSVSCSGGDYCAAAGYYSGYAEDAPTYPFPFVLSDKNGHWGTAILPADASALSGAYQEQISALSCPAAGNCTAGGYYSGESNGTFALSEKNGRWGTAEPVHGAISSLSCPSAGNCGAAGGSTVLAEKNGRWGKSEAIPGLKALYKTGRVIVTIIGNAKTVAVSCSSAGECGAGGFSARLFNNHHYAFAVSEKNGTWRGATTIKASPALGPPVALATGITSIVCLASGDCVAAGQYGSLPLVQGASGTSSQVFVISQHKGIWGSPEALRHLAALNAGGDAAITSLACRSAGNCAAGGYYTDGNGHSQGFVVSETNSRWTAAQEVPGLASLNAGGNAAVASVSCGAVGSCSAGGTYTDGNGHTYGFVVNKTKAGWGVAEKLPLFSVLKGTGDTGITSVSCASAGNCSAGGFYTDPDGHRQPAVANEISGRWHGAVEIAIAALNADGLAQISSLSCFAAGNCSAAGTYADASGRTQVFTTTEKNNVWSAAAEVRGLAALNAGGKAAVVSLSCAAKANCAAGGSYTDGSGHRQAFVVDEKNGIWLSAEEVPGTTALNAGGNAAITSVSCPTPGHCAGGGYYTDHTGHLQAFVASQ